MDELQEWGRKVGSGLQLGGQTRGLVANCASVQNGSRGIVVYDHAQPTLEANTCQHNEEGGIVYFDSAAGTARHNTCSDNSEAGILVCDRAQPTLEANTCLENPSSIIYMDNAAGVARDNILDLDLMLGPDVHPKLQGNRLPPDTAQSVPLAPDERMLYEVPHPKGATLFQAGAKHYFGDGRLTITNRRLILQSDVGGTQQVLLRDIVNVSREDHWLSHHVRLGFSNPTLAFQLDCKGKAGVDKLASMIEEALATA